MSSPNRITLRQSLAMVWRTLRSMRTALVLLLLLALASVVGSLLPQIPNSPQRVGLYLVDHPFWGEAFRRAELFDVFGSWWFSLLVVLLVTSLVACLLPRSRAHLRAIRQPPVQAREIDAFKLYEERPVPGTPQEVVASSHRVLRRRLFRVAADPGGTALAAEKGILREAGSLVFHWAFLLIIAGVLIGKGTGYSGRATIVEGQTWTDAALNYNGELRTGRFFGGDFSGAQIELLSFDDAFHDSGVPMDFVSKVALHDPDGTLVRTDEVRVNHPVTFDGLRLFQFGFGWAPVVRVERDGRPIWSGPVLLQPAPPPDGVSQLAMPWLGFVKLSSLEPQVAIELTLWPDSRAYAASLLSGQPQAMVGEFAPFLRYAVWEGRLTDPSQSSLDMRLMHRVGHGVIGASQTVDLARGCAVPDPAASAPSAPIQARACPGGARAPALTMGFGDLRRFSVLQVSKDSGVPIVLGAAILVLLGLLPALYTSRRKLWVRAVTREGGTVLQVGGFALQRKSQFGHEFAKVVDALVEAAGGTPAAEPEMAGSR